MDYFLAPLPGGGYVEVTLQMTLGELIISLLLLSLVTFQLGRFVWRVLVGVFG